MSESMSITHPGLTAWQRACAKYPKAYATQTTVGLRWFVTTEQGGWNEGTGATEEEAWKDAADSIERSPPLNSPGCR